MGLALAYVDKTGNRTTVTDANGKTTQYGYSSFGMLVSIADPAGRIQAYKYNLTGQKTKMTDRIGNTTNYVYNSLDLVTEISVVEAGKNSATDSIGYDYDRLGNRIQMADATGTYTYAYNQLQRLVSVSKNASLQISYTYTSDGAVATASYGGTTTAYTYYSNGRLHTVRNNGQGADYTYDDSGNVEQVSYVGGAKTQFTYYNNNAARYVTNKNSVNAAFSAYTYTYDLAGRQSSKIDSYGITTYGYDAAGRVETVAMPGKTSVYGYDDAGNRVSLTEEYSDAKTFIGGYQYIKKETAYEYSVCNELTIAVEKVYNSSYEYIAGKESSYYYDPNGNQYSVIAEYLTPLSGNGEEGLSLDGLSGSADEFELYVDATTNTFDVWNRLVSRSAVKGTEQTITEFVYNGDGLRTSKTVKSSTSGYVAHTTNYLYDGQYVVQESGSATATYVRGLNYVAKIGVSNGVHYYMYNAHGDVVQVVNGSGTVKNHYEYDIFGETILEIEEIENSIMYAGEFYDASSGLYYLRSRYYDPAIGRFINEDSYRGDAFNPASLNLYTYCWNDPVSYIDPSGHNAQYPEENAYFVQGLGWFEKGTNRDLYNDPAYKGVYPGGTLNNVSGNSSGNSSNSGSNSSGSSSNQPIGPITKVVTITLKPLGSSSVSSGSVASKVSNVTVAGMSISNVHKVNDKYYAGIREMIYALEFGLGLAEGRLYDSLIPLSARRVIWDEVYKTATVRVTNRQSGQLVEKSYKETQASEAKMFLSINGSIMIGVRELSKLAGLEEYLDWYIDSSTGVEFASLNDQKKVIVADAKGNSTTYTGFSANDNTYIRRSDAVALLGTGYTLTEHERIRGYVNVSAAMSRKYGDSADNIMANFHKTTAMKNGTTTLIAAVPEEQKNHPAQVIRVGEYGLIRIFAKMDFPDITGTARRTREEIIITPAVAQADRQKYQDLVTVGIGDLSGTWANVWGDGKDFHVSSQTIWHGSGSAAISSDQAFHTFEVKPGIGMARAGPKIVRAADGITVGKINWDNDSPYKAHLFENTIIEGNVIYDSNPLTSNTITHEVFHLLGVEDAYEYPKDLLGFFKPRASTSLVPNGAVMHKSDLSVHYSSEVRITNLEIRMLFDAKTDNTWIEFEGYEKGFVIESVAGFSSMLNPVTRTAEQINKASEGNMLNNDGMIIVSYKKSGQYLRPDDRPTR